MLQIKKKKKFFGAIKKPKQIREAGREGAEGKANEGKMMNKKKRRGRKLVIIELKSL